MGTEDRVNDPNKKMPANSVIIPYVTFPGQEIKDLIVHDSSPTPEVDKKPLPSPPKKQPTKPTNVNTTTTNASQQQQHAKVKPPVPGPTDDKKQKSTTSNVSASTAIPKKETRPSSTVVPPNTSTVTTTTTSSSSTGAGTGAHLLKLREKKGTEGSVSSSKPDEVGEFDFSAGLNMFKKNDVLAKVATETEVIKEIKYKKDDFFDSLSCDLTDRKEGRNTRLSNSEERILNQDTFGAIALQNNYRRNYSRGGNSSGRGGGRSSGRGRGGRGRGNSNYNNQNAVKV